MKIKTGNILIGNNAGSDLDPKAWGVVIIGDNIRSLDPNKNKKVIFFGDRMAVGEKLLGKKCNLKEIIEGYLKKQNAKRTTNKTSVRTTRPRRKNS